MHFAGQDPLGQRIRLIDGTPRAIDRSVPMLSAEIVGVVPNIRQRNVREADPDPVIYVPYRVDPQRSAVLLVRGSGDPAALASIVREQMRALEPDLPLYSIQTLDQLLAQDQRQQRVVGGMFAVFAVIALVLSSVGLFAITAYAVTQRTNEIGVRIALGARPANVIWLLLRQALWQLAIGLVVGMAGAMAVGRLLQSLLAQTSSSDPVTLASTAVIMVLISLGACLLPALRAARLDPIRALRYE
jgi:predicted lysophospholipase L1 biosynthesis ABC-type transport system permease subunit